MRYEFFMKSFLEGINLDPFYPYAGEETDGLIKLGKVVQNNQVFGLDINELAHTLIVGRTQIGKTNLNLLITSQLIAKGIKCWIFSFKRDERNLIKLFPNDLWILRWNQLKINPLEPPANTNVREWINLFTDIFCYANYLLYGSRNLLIEQLNDLYFENEGNKNYPTMFCLQERLNKLSLKTASRSFQYLDSLKNRINGCLTNLGMVFDCIQGYRLEKLLQKNIVFELDGLDEDSRAFLIMFLLTWIFKYKIDNNLRHQQAHNVFIFDEAHFIFNDKKDKDFALGNSPLGSFVRMIAEFSSALIICDQIPSSLSSYIKANSSNKIMFQLGDGKDILEMKISAGLNNEQAEANYMLLKGVALVRTVKSPQVFVIQVPLFPLLKDVDDYQLGKIMEPVIRNLSYVPRKDAGIEEEKKSEFKIFQDIKDFMKVLAQDQFMPITKVYKLSNLSLGKGDKIKKVVISKGYVNEHKINLGTQGSLSTFLEITKLGYKFLDDNGIFYEIPKGKGSFQHKFWQAVICQFYLNSGYRVSIEGLDYGVDNTDYWKLIDVIAEKNGERLIIEVELNSQNVLNNIKRDMNLTQDFYSLIIATTKELLPKLKKLIEDNFNDDIKNKISIRLLYEFL